jgi:hypothetical protein
VTQSVPTLWHVREPDLNVGDIVEPGRWGRIVIQSGAYGEDQRAGSPHFFREHLLELFRVTSTEAPASRLACAFAYESHEIAVVTAAQRGQACFEVEPVDPGRPLSRHDMLWITWIGEPGADVNRVANQLRGYWSGQATEDVADHATSAWEWLVASGLRITGRAG